MTEAVAVLKGSHYKGMKYAGVRVIEAGSLAPGGHTIRTDTTEISEM